MSHATEYDAHGHKDHGHVIVSQWTLRSILALLMFFTLLTVGLAWFETWLGQVFHIELPAWINVFVALSIAVVKTTLVVMYFMQLRYDNPMNTMVFVFTILTVFFFLGFTAIDLGNRGTLDPRKAVYIVEGGTGLTGMKVEGTVSKGMPADTPIVEAARIVAKNAGTYHPHAKDEHGDGRDRGPLQDMTSAGFAPVRPEVGSSAQASRPVRGVTIPGLPGYVAPGAHDEHAHGSEKKDEHAKPETKPETKPDAKHDAKPGEPAKH